MSFFAVLLALLLEQFKPLPRANWVHDSLIGWVRWTGRNFDAGRAHHAMVVWCVTALAPALAAWGVYLFIVHFSLLLALVWTHDKPVPAAEAPPPGDAPLPDAAAWPGPAPEEPHGSSVGAGSAPGGSGGTLGPVAGEGPNRPVA